MDDIGVNESAFDAPAVQGLLAEWNAELAATVRGFSPSGGSQVRTGDFVAPDGAFLLATDGDGAALGCGGIRRLDAATAEIKRLFVLRSARGRGIGLRLLAGLEDRARSAGFTAVRLDTMGNDPAALALFLATGYRPIADYNGNPRARHWFGKPLTSGGGGRG